MKRLLAAVTLTFGMSSAEKIDCNTLVVDANWFISYKTVEEFPKPVKTVDLALADRTTPYKFNDCGVKVNLDDKEFSIQASSIPNLLKAMGKTLSWGFGVSGVQGAGVQPKFVKAARLSVDLPDGLMYDKVRVGGYFTGNYLGSDALMAVRVDQGKLLPLLYDGSFRQISLDPKMNSLNVYIRSSKPLVWQAIKIDTVNNKITYYRKMPFPAK